MGGALLAATGLFMLTVVTFKKWRLRRAARYLADKLDAAPLKPGMEDPTHHRLRNVVEEMSLAAGIPMPAIYEVRSDSAVNAMSVGHTTADAAIFVTEGALS